MPSFGSSFTITDADNNKITRRSTPSNLITGEVIAMAKERYARQGFEGEVTLHILDDYGRYQRTVMIDQHHGRVIEPFSPIEITSCPRCEGNAYLISTSCYEENYECQDCGHPFTVR